MDTIMRELKTEAELIECTRVIRDSFKTVADEFNLTAENAPTHPSNMTLERLKASVDMGLKLFGMFDNQDIIGCIGIEKGNEEYSYYIERVAILPLYRHKGLGKELLDFAFGLIGELKGRKALITIIAGHEILKKWYINYGFKETRVKKFDHLPFEVSFMEKILL
jgi:ribosomal protein S18 acetylase RimI-like enzyme